VNENLTGKTASKVAALEGEFRQHVAAVNSFVEATSRWQHDFTQSTDNWRRELSAKIDSINRDSRPNYGAWIQFAGILLSIIFFVSVPIAYHFNSAILGLDLKLQKEYNLINETTKEKVASLQKNFDDIKQNGSPVTRERLVRLESVAAAVQAGIIADLEELRQRRLKDNITK
jgi:hypothetical protein